MDNANIAVIKESIQALQALVYWHESGAENPGYQTDAAIDAQRAIVPWSSSIIRLAPAHDLQQNTF
jgi:hypothetical protein